MNPAPSVIIRAGDDNVFRKPLKWLFWAVLLIATGSAALSIGQKAARWVQKENQLLATAGEQAVDALRSMGEAGEAFLSRAGEDRMTLLFTGVDETWSRLDAIMLVIVDLEDSNLRVLQIPTDIYINRASNSTHHISSIYADATAKAQKRGDSQTEAVRKGNIALKGFLDENMGIEIDHYISLNTDGLQTVVDSVGGVTVKLSQAIDCDDDSRDLHLHLSAGEHRLDGSEAVDFVRYGGEGNDGRSANTTKLFLSAFFRKVKHDFSLSAALGLLKAGFNSTVSDLALADMVPLARGMLSISSSDVRMATVRGRHTADETGMICEVLDRQSTIELLAAYLPDQTGIDGSRFDPHRVFCSAGNIEKLYYGDK